MSALRAGVVGNPIGHSLSPLIHGAWIEAAGLDAEYRPYLSPRDDFAAFVADLRHAGLRGVNVTLPFKEEALALADRASALAAAIGAANLLVFRADGEVFADNTDGAGMLAALRAQAPGFDPRDHPTLVLGAGGAARGAVAALVAAGAPRVQVLNRTFDKALALAQAMGPTVEAVEDAGLAFATNTAVINATSAILSQAAEDYPLDRSPPGSVIMHMTYKPLHPPFLVEARRRGLTIVDGLEMLIGQAAPSFEALYGQAPDPTVDVRGLALAALGARDA